MNSLKDRVLIVLRGAPRALSSPEVARILGLPTSTVTSPLSRLCAYGKVEAEVSHYQRFYRPKKEAA